MSEVNGPQSTDAIERTRREQRFEAPRPKERVSELPHPQGRPGTTTSSASKAASKTLSAALMAGTFIRNPQVVRARALVVQNARKADSTLTQWRTERRDETDTHAREQRQERSPSDGRPGSDGQRQEGQSSSRDTPHPPERSRQGKPGFDMSGLPLSMQLGLTASMATAGAPPAALAELVEKIEVLIKQTQHPTLALTLSGALQGRVELTRTGPGSISIALAQPSRWNLQDRQALEAQLAQRGLRVSRWL